MRALIVFFAILVASNTLAAEPLVLNLVVNGIAKGDVDAIYDQGGYWLTEQTLKSVGINTPKGTQNDFAGIRYFRSDQLEGINSRLDDTELRVYLDLAAGDLGQQIISLNPPHAEQWPQPAPFSAYLNYQIAALQQSSHSGVNYEFSPTINLNQGAFNFRSAHDYSTQTRDSAWIRLNTTLDYDRPDLMFRATLGDLTPQIGPLSSSQAIGGIGISRVFNMQPDFSSNPNFSAQTPVTQPSTAEIYLNGQRIETINLQPGMYQFNDLRYFSGLQDVEIIVRDEFGNAQHYSIPYYFDDSLLKAGLHEFSYNAGLARANGSFDTYDGLAYSLYHRVGVTDWLTLGAQASGQQSDNSYGVLANLKFGHYGTLASTFSWADRDTQASGDAQQLQYRYLNQAFSLNASAQRQSPTYWRQNAFTSGLTVPKWSANLGVGWGDPVWGSWSLNIGRQLGYHSEQTFNRYQLGYSFSPLRQLSVSTQARVQDDGQEQQWSGFINISFFFGQGTSLYAGTQCRNERTLSSASLSRSSPMGEGWGYNLGIQQQELGTDYTAWLERKLRYGTANLSAMQSDNGSETSNNWRLAWSGALAYAQGNTALTRPITQNFAVVEIAGLSDVGVLQNGNMIGKTDSQGVIFLPELASYGYQQISLEQNDIPIQFSVDYLQQDLLSGNYDGRLVRFNARQITAVSGQLLSADGKPMANTQVELKNDKDKTTFSTAMDGRFYLENLSTGQYTLNAGVCSASLILAHSAEIVTELPPIICQGNTP